MLLPFLPEPAAAIPPPLPKGDEIRVSLLENVSHSRPQVAVFPDGGFVVVWTVGAPDFHGRSVIHARLFGQDGAPAGGELRLVDRSGESQFADQVVADRNGSFLLVWTEMESPDWKSNVFVRRFNRDGTPRGQRIQANVPHKSSRYDGVLAVGADGRFAVAWSSWVDLKPDYRSYANSVARIFSAKGTPLTKEFIVGVGYPGIGDDNTYSEPAGVALGPDGSVTVQLQDFTSPDLYENYLRRYDSKGKLKKAYALSDPLFCCVDTPGAALGMGQDGSVVAAWSDQWAVVMAQRFTAKGDPRGETFRISEEEDFIQEDPRVAVVSGGTFVIAWMEKERDGDGGGIFGRVFSAAGKPLSDDLQINTTTAGWQYQPAIAAAPGGPVVAVWVSYGSDGSSRVFARRLTSEP